MTYILGARCIDGVALIADKIVTIDDGKEKSLTTKLFSDFDNRIIGYSGSRVYFEKFLNQIHIKITPDLTNYEFLKVLSDEMDSYSKYKNFLFDIIIAIYDNKNSKAILKYLPSYGGISTCDTYEVIGSGKPYGMQFLRKYWNKSLNMHEVGYLGYFIIKLIEINGLDLTVGTQNEYPSIWFIPDTSKPFQPTDIILKEYERTIQNKVEEYNKINSNFKIIP